MADNIIKITVITYFIFKLHNENSFLILYLSFNWNQNRV